MDKGRILWIGRWDILFLFIEIETGLFGRAQHAYNCLYYGTLLLYVIEKNQMLLDKNVIISIILTAAAILPSSGAVKQRWSHFLSTQRQVGAKKLFAPWLLVTH